MGLGDFTSYSLKSSRTSLPLRTLNVVLTTGSKLPVRDYSPPVLTLGHCHLVDVIRVCLLVSWHDFKWHSIFVSCLLTLNSLMVRKSHSLKDYCLKARRRFCNMSRAAYAILMRLSFSLNSVDLWAIFGHSVGIASVN